MSIRWVILFLLFIGQTAVCGNRKFQKWLIPSYFRGYNILHESPKSLGDVIDFRNYGGNFLQIGTKGFLAEDRPYSIVEENIRGTDSLVKYCRTAGVYYAIAVRSGPGAYDAYQETAGFKPASRIWDKGNSKERKLYARMLRMIAERYSGDSLFAGLNIVVEPRPKVFVTPANSSGLYRRFLEDIYDIRMDRVYRYFISEIRKSDSALPLIIENFAYSTPELFPAYVIDDPYVVYDAHLYTPYDLTHSEKPYSRSYPGEFMNISMLGKEFHDSSFIRNVILAELKKFQENVKAPVIIGEFGLMFPQAGGERYISDVLSICLEYGWHFALWDWRRGPGMDWNIENFDDSGRQHWNTVLKFFYHL